MREEDKHLEDTHVPLGIAAEVSGIALATLYSYVRKKKVRFCKIKHSGGLRIHADDLDKLIQIKNMKDKLGL